MSSVTLYDRNVVQTLDKLHMEAKKDWFYIYRTAPQYIMSLLRNKYYMDIVPPETFEKAHLSISKEQGVFMYNLCRTANCKTIVEFGCSFGLSTIYLAAAAKDTGGKVITTEILESKCAVAKRNLDVAGLLSYVEILQGDALQTLSNLKGTVDFLFLDGWKTLYNDVLDLVKPKFRGGSIVLGDNVNFKDCELFLQKLEREKNNYTTTIINKNASYSVFHEDG